MSERRYVEVFPDFQLGSRCGQEAEGGGEDEPSFAPAASGVVSEEGVGNSPLQLSAEVGWTSPASDRSTASEVAATSVVCVWSGRGDILRRS